MEVYVCLTWPQFVLPKLLFGVHPSVSFVPADTCTVPIIVGSPRLITPRLLLTPIIGVSLLSDLLTREKKILRSGCKTTFLEQDLMSNLFDSRNLCFCYQKIAVFVLRKCVRLFENKSMFLFEGELYGVKNIFSNAFEERTPIYSHNKIFLIYNICSVVQNPK